MFPIRLLFLSLLFITSLFSETNLPVRGFSIAVPSPERLDDFIDFMKTSLGPNHVNKLVLRVDYNFEYDSHPELRSKNPLTRDDAKRLAETAVALGIEIIPQFNLLGHQSWSSSLGNLLNVYPQFDETPGIDLPEQYEWPNEDGLYCKSYCPLHPEVHAVIFALVDELMDAFGATTFHAGMDEVFYIGHKDCPRCSGKNTAELFANEVSLIRNHLNKNGQTLWIWGDRLLDGTTTGLGEWEASINGTHAAIDLIPKDVVICDWHYERAEPTAVYFAMHGLQVITCPWNKTEVAREQLAQTLLLRKHANTALSNRMLGMMQTVWSPAGTFLDKLSSVSVNAGEPSDVDCYFKLFESFPINQTD